jgi:hypothetical protein
MITITNNAEIATAYDKTTAHEGAYPTCRVIDHEAPGCQEWAEHCEIEGVPAKVYYIFEDEEAEVEDGSDMPWDAKHVSKIEIAEKDDDGDYDSL